MPRSSHLAREYKTKCTTPSLVTWSYVIYFIKRQQVAFYTMKGIPNECAGNVLVLDSVNPDQMCSRTCVSSPTFVVPGDPGNRPPRPITPERGAA